MSINENILKHLPYGDSFRFVDAIDEVTEDQIRGHFTFREELFFYHSHFQHFPITPAVIVVECMAQIGLACLGIYLERANWNSNTQPTFVFTSQQTAFLKAVFPNETIWVQSQKVYYRFGKLKCKVEAYNARQELVCRGVMDGMMVDKNKLNND